MNTTAFILASGDHTRWFNETCKQLVEIDGEPLLLRTLRQFENLEPYVVCKDGLLLRHVKKAVKIIDSECLCDTVLQTRALWTDRIVFLLGDVCYTDECARRIVGCASIEPRFWTDGVDIFAMQFLWPNGKQLMAACELGIHNNRLRKTDGKAWDIYRYFVPAVKHWPIYPKTEPLFTEFVGDKTQDFDTVDDHERFVNKKYKNYLHRTP